MGSEFLDIPCRSSSPIPVKETLLLAELWSRRCLEEETIINFDVIAIKYLMQVKEINLGFEVSISHHFYHVEMDFTVVSYDVETVSNFLSMSEKSSTFDLSTVKDVYRRRNATKMKRRYNDLDPYQKQVYCAKKNKHRKGQIWALHVLIPMKFHLDLKSMTTWKKVYHKCKCHGGWEYKCQRWGEWDSFSICDFSMYIYFYKKEVPQINTKLVQWGRTEKYKLILAMMICDQFHLSRFEARYTINLEFRLVLLVTLKSTHYKSNS
ncbi:OSBP(oxysterol binding protein)-related protein1C [Striga asiatica]|uniref:OSBP(Oxysterol binding protein)-related protein1C n=1 Tax=Striga asiatica TaxID=4170 RepID=A0A5A7QMG7_STRAF|nr:OSBP(oxysterol binding protein)-related protein1C [Striga asiatica]